VEALSVLHATRWRGELADDRAVAMRDRLLEAPIATVEPEGLALEAWKVADEFGWAKANDIALARLLDCRLVTLDARLRRGTARLGFVVGATEL
jgi:predicted nucleic acid-binding protein